MSLIRKIYDHPYRYALLVWLVVFFYFNQEPVNDVGLYLSLGIGSIFVLAFSRMFSHLFFSQVYQAGRGAAHLLKGDLQKTLNFILLGCTAIFLFLPVLDLLMTTLEVERFKFVAFLFLFIIYVYSIVMKLEQRFRIRSERLVWLLLKSTIYLGVVFGSVWLFLLVVFLVAVT